MNGFSLSEFEGIHIPEAIKVDFQSTERTLRVREQSNVRFLNSCHEDMAMI